MKQTFKFLTALVIASLVMTIMVTRATAQSTQTERVCTTNTYGQETCTDRTVIVREDGNVVIVPSELPDTGLDAKSTSAVALIIALGVTSYILRKKIV